MSQSIRARSGCQAPLGTAAVLVLLVVLLAGPTSTAHATFPGVNGQIAFSTGGDRKTLDLFAINFDGTFARPLAVRAGSDNLPAWSPDGKEFAWVNDVTGKTQIRIADADGRNVRRFVPSDGFDNGPAWSPDGRKLLFTSGRDGTGTSELYVANKDSSDVRRLTFRPLEDGRPNWSPDGTQIAWHSRESNTDNFHIYVMNADGSNQRRLFPTRTTRVGDFSPNWSPDGRRIVWDSYANSGGGELWVANSDGSNPQRILSLKKGLQIYSPVWSPDGKFIAYTAPFAYLDNQSQEVWVAFADGTGSASVIGISKTQFGTPIDWQPLAERGAQPDSLLRNGGAEDGFGGNFVGVDYLVPSWETNGGLTGMRYGLPGLPTAPRLPSVIQAHSAQKPGGRFDGAGKRFFFGGTNPVSTAVQEVSLTAPAAEIDTGRSRVALAGLLGGKGVEGDEGTVVATFLSGAGTPLGLLQLGPVTPAERNNQTTLIGKSQAAFLPAGARRIRVTLTATRRVGSTNDAYFDNLSLVYSKPAAELPKDPPPPVQPTQPVVTPGATGGGPAVPGRVSSLRISPTPFAVSGSNTAAVAQRGRPPRGAKISYRLDRATVVTLKFDRRSSGRRNSSGRCVKATSANRNRKRCTRNIPAGSILRFGRAGSNTVTFTGRVKRKALKSGSYRLTASAGNNVSVRFRIVKR